MGVTINSGSTPDTTVNASHQFLLWRELQNFTGIGTDFWNFCTVTTLMYSKVKQAIQKLMVNDLAICVSKSRND